MIKKEIIGVTIGIIILLAVVTFETYAYFVLSGSDLANLRNMSTITQRSGMVFSTLYGEMDLNISYADMLQGNSGQVAGEDSTILTINFQPNTSYNMVCEYDILFEWMSEDKYQFHTSGVTGKEYTIQANLASNVLANEGNNRLKKEIDIADVIGNNSSKIVVSNAQIAGVGSETSISVWTITSRFYNVDADQEELAGKAFSSRFRVVNVNCVPGNINDK